MNKALICFLLLAAAGIAGGAEPADSLRQVVAPGGEFVKVPARYVLDRLVKSARHSGLPGLEGFEVDLQMPGLAEQRITIDLTGMDLLRALNAVAAASGSEIGFAEGRVVLRDPAAAPAVPPAVADENMKPEKGKKEKQEVDFREVGSALVFVETGVASGSGFIAEMDGKVYLFSNQHNFMGAGKTDLRTMNGRLLQPVSFEFSRDRDLVRFELGEEDLRDVTPLQLAVETPGIDVPVVVFGNSAGGNVATELKGKILGVGPGDIEVDADIVPGNSGSPVIGTDLKVVAVATYVSFELELDKDDPRRQIFKGTRFDKTRRYGVRIPADGWVKTDLKNFLNQTYRIADLSNQLEIMLVLVQYWSGNEDFDEQANRIMTAYATQGGRIKRPYEFHYAESEQAVELWVKAFKRNHEEFVAKVSDMQLTKSDLAKMSNANAQMSTSKIQLIDDHLRSMLLDKVRQGQDALKQYDWMSNYLRESAEPLDELAGEMVRVLEGQRNILPRIKRWR